MSSTISELTAKVLLNQKFISDVSTPLSILLVQENQLSVPPDPTETAEYINFFVDGIPGGPKSARGTYTKHGIATTQIFTPLGTGYGRFTAIGQAITNAFQDAQWADRVVIVTDVTVVPVGKSGSYYQTNVTITFQYENDGTD